MADGDQSPTAGSAKFLTFVLAGETYGLEATKVEEIVAAVPATRVPGAPNFLRGVFDLRGRIVPVIDLRVRFALATAPDTLRTCIVVVRLAGRKTAVGLLAEEVLEVVGIESRQIEPPPAFGPAVDLRCLRGIAKVGDRVVLLLDAEAALSADLSRMAVSRAG
jgi:purine-binding chemotaxis protein CheW